MGDDLECVGRQAVLPRSFGTIRGGAIVPAGQFRLNLWGEVGNSRSKAATVAENRGSSRLQGAAKARLHHAVDVPKQACYAQEPRGRGGQKELPERRASFPWRGGLSRLTLSFQGATSIAWFIPGTCREAPGSGYNFSYPMVSSGAPPLGGGGGGREAAGVSPSVLPASSR